MNEHLKKFKLKEGNDCATPLFFYFTPSRVVVDKSNPIYTLSRGRWFLKKTLSVGLQPLDTTVNTDYGRS